MTQITRKLLERFEAHNDEERSELITEPARRTPLVGRDGPFDDDLIASADQLFIDIDRREQP